MPAAAAAFWAGLVAWSAARPWLAPWMAIAIGLSALAGAWLAAPRRIAGRDALAGAGLVASEPAAVSVVAAGARGSGRGAPAAAALGLVGVFALGCGWGGVQDARLDGQLLGRLAPERVTIEGSLRTDPVARRLRVVGDGRRHARAERRRRLDAPRVGLGERRGRRAAGGPGRRRAPGRHAARPRRLRGSPSRSGTRRGGRAHARHVPAHGRRHQPVPARAQVFRSFVGRSIAPAVPAERGGAADGSRAGRRLAAGSGIARDFQATGPRPPAGRLRRERGDGAGAGAGARDGAAAHAVAAVRAGPRARWRSSWC